MNGRWEGNDSACESPWSLVTLQERSAINPQPCPPVSRARPYQHSTAQHISPECDFGSVCSLADLVRHNADAYTAATWLWADGECAVQCRAVPCRSVRAPTDRLFSGRESLRCCAVGRRACRRGRWGWAGLQQRRLGRVHRPCCAVIQRMHARAQQCTAQHRPGAMQRIALQGSHRRRGRWRPS